MKHLPDERWIRHRVAFATEARYPDLPPDDRLALPALAARGIAVVPCVWSDPQVDWGAFDAVVLRSCWDYHVRLDEFRRWLDRLDAVRVPLWNSLPVARWNLEKTYLRALATAGVATVPTEWLACGARVDLAALLDGRGWAEVVIKPVVSAAAYETVRCTRAEIGAVEPRVAALLATRALMVQPYLPEIAEAGEWSLLFFGGAFSHAVRKRPRPGDFRVQAEFGGGAERATPPAALVAAARAIVERAPGAWLYARVDGVETAEGFRLLELEMLEPSLFFALDARAPERFARALGERLEGDLAAAV